MRSSSGPASTIRRGWPVLASLPGRNGDFFGSTVQLAARLCMQAAPGQTLVSSSVAELCGHRQLTDVGELTLKGFPNAVRAHAVVDGA